jgi:5-methylcytosine-specific restriction endonuclease McrA
VSEPWGVDPGVGGLRPDLYEPLDVTAADDPDLRRTVLARDDYACALCGSPTDLTLDHVVHMSRAGADDGDDLRTLCVACADGQGVAA